MQLKRYNGILHIHVHNVHVVHTDVYSCLLLLYVRRRKSGTKNGIQPKITFSKQ